MSSKTLLLNADNTASADAGVPSIANATNRKVALFVASSHPLFLEGIRMILRDNPFIQLVGEAQHLGDTVREVALLHPEVVLLDLPIADETTADCTILDAISRMKTTDVKLRIFVLTIAGELESVAKYRKAGASGCILPETPLPQFLYTIRAADRSGRGKNGSAEISGRGPDGRKARRSRSPLYPVKQGRCA